MSSTFYRLTRYSHEMTDSTAQENDSPMRLRVHTERLSLPLANRLSRLLSLGLVALSLAGCSTSSTYPVISLSTPALVIEYENNPLRQTSKQRWYDQGFGILEITTSDNTSISMAVADHDPSTDIMTFLAEDRRSFQIFNGRIVGSLGFGADIGGLATVGSNPFKLGNFADFRSRSVHWILTDQSGRPYARSIARYHVNPETEMQIAGRNHRIREVSEDWWIPELSWRINNSYWVTAQGVVLMSEQSIHPQFPRLHTTFWSRHL